MNFDPSSINFGFNSGGYGNGYGSADPSQTSALPDGLSIPAGNYNPAALNTSMSTPNFNPTGVGGGGGFLGGLGGALGKAGVGFNMPTLNAGIGGLKSLADIWTSFQALNLANQQLKMTRGVANANLANQTQSYNTNLSDRATARGVAEGMSPGAVQDYIAQNSLHNRTV